MAIRANQSGGQAHERNRFSWFGKNASCVRLRQHRLILCPGLLGGRILRLAVGAMIDIGADADAPRKVGHSAGMVLMKVRE